MIELSKDNFDKIISNGIVLVDFYSKRCSKCRLIEQSLNYLANKFNVMFAKIDVIENRDIARKYGVIGLPVLILFKDGEILGKIKPNSKEEIEKFIEETISQYHVLF